MDIQRTEMWLERTLKRVPRKHSFGAIIAVLAMALLPVLLVGPSVASGQVYSQKSQVIQTSGSIVSNNLLENRIVFVYAWMQSGGVPTLECQRIATALANSNSIFVTHSHLGATDWREPYTTGGSLNLIPAVINLFHSKGVKVYSYVQTEWGARPLANVKDHILRDSLLGVDGIFIDEGFAFAEGTGTPDAIVRIPYMQEIHAYAKELGLPLIYNTGTRYTHEIVMSFCDILCIEGNQEWLYFPTAKGPANQGGGYFMSKYPADRFLGLSYGLTSATTAITETQTAQSLGFSWHYSMNNIWAIENWFEQYEAGI